MRLKASLLFALALALGHAAAAQDKPGATRDAQSGMVYGKDHSFTLAAPDGWVLDNRSGASQGIHAVFHPASSSWRDSPAVMYANTAPRRDAGDTLEAFIERDLLEFKKRTPGLKVTDAQAQALRQDRKAVVKHLSGDRFGNFEAVAYIEEGKVVVMLVLSARTRKDFDSALPAFRKLVASYFFITDKMVLVETPPKKP